MVRAVVVVLLGAAVVTTAASVGYVNAVAKGEKSAAVTLTGTLVDSRCQAKDAVPALATAEKAEGGKGCAHMTTAASGGAAGAAEMEGCASMCAKAGVPVGLLMGKTVVIVLAPAPAFAPHMGETAQVTGYRVFGGSAVLAEKVQVKAQDGSWSEVAIAAIQDTTAPGVVEKSGSN